MPHGFLIYVLAVSGVPLLTLAFRNESPIRTHGGAWAIAGCSLGALVLLMGAFPQSGSGAGLILDGWQIPGASFAIAIDSLSALFLIPLLILGVACALYGPSYMGGHAQGKFHWFFTGLLLGSMVLVLLARNAILFLIAWEIMSLASFCLVIHDKKSEMTLRAGWTYFVTTHLSAVFLLALFFLLAEPAQSFDFGVWADTGLSAAQANAAFVLAVIGFGLKAGFFPFHVWLPLAHPAAPSHISGLMSGIMIKMGIYGILRTLTFVAPFQAWWAITILVLGAVSGILGVLFAIGQHDIKRLLAYSSIENIGIILLGIGAGMCGVIWGNDAIALLGFAGALLHVVNHALFKGLLFLGAGSIIRQAGTGEIDRLGGLLKRMPWTGFLFLAGCAAICGLPLLNGFISEILIYTSAILGAVHSNSLGLALTGIGTIIALAIIGGLAAACFTKVFGIVFLGESREPEFRSPREAPPGMVSAMAVLAALCAVIGLWSVCVLPFILPAANLLAVPASIAGELEVRKLISLLSILPVGLLVIAALTFGIMKLGARRRPATAAGVTWDCGYGAPAPSMQYTGSSFASPVIKHFAVPLALKTTVSEDASLLPTATWSLHSHVEDWMLSAVYAPAIRAADRVLESLRWFQHGKLGLYVMYIALSAMGLIAWKFLP